MKDFSPEQLMMHACAFEMTCMSSAKLE